jgi:hypothetical protein
MTTETVAVDTNNQTVNDALRNTNSAQTTTGTDTTTAEALTFEKWIATQPDNIKTLVDAQLDRSQSALEAERSSRRGMEKQLKQLKELSGAAGNSDELKTQIDKLSADFQESDTRANFYEQAHLEGIKNLRLAYTAAREYDLVGKGGKVDFAELKHLAPELFGTTKIIPVGNAGNGNGQTGIVKPDMNRAIRVMAGRQAA